jgi:hypothetical protein
MTPTDSCWDFSNWGSDRRKAVRTTETQKKRGPTFMVLLAEQPKRHETPSIIYTVTG